MKQLKIPAGTRVLIAPLQSAPSSEELDPMLKLIASADGISEAHLTQCFALGVMNDPARILSVVLEKGAEADRILRHLNSPGIGADATLDVWVRRPNDPVLRTIRQAGSRIYPPKA